MQHRVGFTVGLVALGAVFAGAAQAQYYYYQPRGLFRAPMFDDRIPAREALMIVRSAGLHPLTQPARRGMRYVLLASDQMGTQLRVVVDAFDGRIVRVSPSYDPRFASRPVPAPVPESRYASPDYPRRSAAPPPRDPPPVIYGSRTPPQGSRSNPTRDARHASAPPAADSTPRRPERTPLPRPRPRVAAAEPAPQASAPAGEAAPAAAPQQPAPTATAPAETPSAPAKAPSTPTELVPVAPLE